MFDASATSHASPALLAECRKYGRVSDLPLPALPSRADAEAFQSAAVRALGSKLGGHKVGATSIATRQLLNCRRPFHAPIPHDYIVDSGARLRIPDGFLGIECEFGYVMARDFPAPDEELTVPALALSVQECVATLEIVGRRVRDTAPLTESSAIADYGLNVALVRGAPIPVRYGRDLTALTVVAQVDGVTVATGSAQAVLGGPLDALLWLARALQRRGDLLRRGQIIATGTCTGIIKVAAGCRFEGCFGGRAAVQVAIDG